jgi:polyhydroxyalkanoate synthesis regulator phasin
MTVGGETDVEKAQRTIETDVEKAQRTVEEQRARLTRTVEKLILASIGAVALAQETLENLVDRMVARGEQVQDAARKQVDELKETRRRLLGSAKQNVAAKLDTADMQSLQEQVAVLSAKVQELSEAKSAANDTGTALKVPDVSIPGQS